MTIDNRNRAGKTAAGVAVAALVIVLFNPLALPHIDLLELPDFPDLPGWLATALKKGKLIVIAIVIVLAVIGEETVRRRGKDS